MNTEHSKENAALILNVLLTSATVNKKSTENKFVIPPLPYAENALAPYIGEKTIQYHYGKHLLAYITNTNNLIVNTEYENMSLEEIVMKSSGPLFNNAAQVYNHVFYFESLQPHSTDKTTPQDKVKELIDRSFGDFETFKEKFSQAATSLFGSGWAWLIVDKEGKLEIKQAANADNPIKYGKHPILTVDVWEHAYYLDTQNARPKYVENYWNVINWDAVEKRLK